MITDIDWNKYFKDLTNKANIDLLNADYNIDIVIDYKVNPDGSWYRKYKSGWLEQGGDGDAVNVQKVNINFPQPYNSTTDKTTVLVSSSSPSNVVTRAGVTSTGFFINFERTLTNKTSYSWVAYGQGV